jgi:hypothetical protein
MPKVLSRLRIDEVSCVTKGAGENVKIVLCKRAADDDGRDGSFYHKLFAKVGSGRVARPPRRLRGGEPLRDIADAKHALLFTPDGRSLLRDAPTAASIDELASHLLEASGAVPPINKNEDQMREHVDVVSFAKRVVADGESVVSEAQPTELIKQYSDANKLPGEKSSVAFARIFGGDDAIGLNFRKMVQIAKGIAHPHVGA